MNFIVLLVSFISINKHMPQLNLQRVAKIVQMSLVFMTTIFFRMSLMTSQLGWTDWDQKISLSMLSVKKRTENGQFFNCLTGFIYGVTYHLRTVLIAISPPYHLLLRRPPWPSG